MDPRLVQKVGATMKVFHEQVLTTLRAGSSLSEAIEQIESMPVPNFDDLLKRRRSKNSVPVDERCCARRANGERCTRRKKEGSDCCGTHFKGVPHGVVSDMEQPIPLTKREVWAEEINGIVYYIDAMENVYKTEDVLKNKPNPSIYAKWKKEDGVYTIVSA